MINDLFQGRIRLLIAFYACISVIHFLVWVDADRQWFVYIVPILIQLGGVFIVAFLGMELGARPVQAELSQYKSARRRAEGSIQVLMNALLSGDNMVILDGEWRLSVEGQQMATRRFSENYDIPLGASVIAHRGDTRWDIYPQDGFVYVMAPAGDVRSNAQGNVLLGVVPCYLIYGNDEYSLVSITKGTAGVY